METNNNTLEKAKEKVEKQQQERDKVIKEIIDRSLTLIDNKVLDTEAREILTTLSAYGLPDYVGSTFKNFENSVEEAPINLSVQVMEDRKGYVSHSDIGSKTSYYDDYSTRFKASFDVIIEPHTKEWDVFDELHRQLLRENDFLSDYQRELSTEEDKEAKRKRIAELEAETEKLKKELANYD